MQINFWSGKKNMDEPKTFWDLILCRPKSLWRGSKCRQIFGLPQKIWTSTKHFGTCKRARHKISIIYKIYLWWVWHRQKIHFVKVDRRHWSNWFGNCSIEDKNVDWIQRIERILVEKLTRLQDYQSQSRHWNQKAPLIFCSVFGTQWPLL